MPVAMNHAGRILYICDAETIPGVPYWMAIIALTFHTEKIHQAARRHRVEVLGSISPLQRSAAYRERSAISAHPPHPGKNRSANNIGRATFICTTLNRAAVSRQAMVGGIMAEKSLLGWS